MPPLESPVCEKMDELPESLRGHLDNITDQVMVVAKSPNIQAISISSSPDQEKDIEFTNASGLDYTIVQIPDDDGYRLGVLVLDEGNESAAGISESDQAALLGLADYLSDSADDCGEAVSLNFRHMDDPKCYALIVGNDGNAIEYKIVFTYYDPADFSEESFGAPNALKTEQVFATEGTPWGVDPA